MRPSQRRQGWRCYPIREGDPVPYWSSQPWWWWAAGGVFTSRLLYVYVSLQALEVAWVIAGALIVVPPVVRVVWKWNGSHDDAGSTHCESRSDADLCVGRTNPRRWL